VVVASNADLVEGGDLHNVGQFLPILAAYQFPLRKPFRFSTFVDQVEELLTVDGLPEELVTIRNGVIVVLRKIQIPEDCFDESKVVHDKFTCDGCKVKPIVGPRYHCTVCHDFDFCEDCERNQPHDVTHDMIKIRFAAQELPKEFANVLPNLRVSLQFVEEPKVVQEKKEEVPEKKQVVVVEEKKEVAPAIELVEGLSCRVIEDVEVESNLKGNDMFVKTWRVVNNGTVNWPMGAHLRFVSGDEILLVEKVFEALHEEWRTS